MKNYLRSQLGTRMALLFVVSALVPIVLLSIVAFVQVLGQLKQEARRQLRNESRAIAQAMVERFTLAERELAILERVVAAGYDTTPILNLASTAAAPEGVRPFTAVTVGTMDARSSFYGPALPWPNLTAAQQKHLSEGKSLVLSGAESFRGKHLLLVRSLPEISGKPRLIVAQINDEFFWTGLTEYRPTEISQLCILDGTSRILYSFAPMSAEFLKEIARQVDSGSQDLFDWEEHGRKHFVSYRNVFLGPKYGISRLTVVAGRPTDLALAPVAPFQRGFPVLVLLCIWVVVFLTLYEVRRRLIPLKKLIEGTRQIAEQRFDHRVEIATGDEFDDLAKAFNRMSETIGRQLEMLSIVNEIDRGLLSSVELREIVSRAIAGLAHVFKGSSMIVATLGKGEHDPTTVYVQEPTDSGLRIEEAEALSAREKERIAAFPEGVSIAARERLPPYLTPLRDVEGFTFTVLPILLDDHLKGVVGVGFKNYVLPRTDAEHLRQIADQIALAMANASLVRALQQQNWGIVHALARAVDAKSPWTQGHTERVTRLSLILARELGYEARQLQELERGALLHDIGKIGISSSILDKPDSLTDEERLIVREHPRLGMRISEPAGISEEVRNIIAQHHERYDGKGYPLGLSGEAISLSGRIVCVADVADAVAADRPYRKGIPFCDVVELIARDSGKAFDPAVVNAFMRVVANVTSLEELLQTEKISGEEGSRSRSLDGSSQAGVTR